MTEIYAALIGLDICAQLNISNIWLEMDSQVVVDMIKGNSNSWTLLRWINKLRAKLDLVSGKMATQPSAYPPDVVARCFLELYYTTLHGFPGELHRFYKDQSVVSWPQADGEVKSVTTTAEIHEFIISSHLKDSKVELIAVDSQESSLGGVIVVVTARLIIGQHGSRKKFSQTFFLASQATRFFVLKDIFRFVDSEESSSSVVADKETDIFVEKELPIDYNNWSSTVIFFKEKDDWDISVYAFDCDNCCAYYVMTYDFQRVRGCDYKLGYTASDFKLYFVGDVRYDEHHDDLIYDVEVKVYDIRIREWVKGFPKLKAPMRHPIVFSLDERLYVLSSGSYYQNESRFEMLDMNNLSLGWISLPKPSYKENHRIPNHIIDCSKKMLYIRFEDNNTLYSYNFQHSRWCVHYYRLNSPFPARTGSLLNVPWSNDYKIVENYLYGFMMGTLFIRDLEIENEVVGVWDVDISSIVTPDVLLDKYSFGSLVYLGKRNSCPRFFLVIWYKCQSCSGDRHVGTCTFDLRRNLNEATGEDRSFIADPVSYHYPHKNIPWGSGSCNKLCEVK